MMGGWKIDRGIPIPRSGSGMPGSSRFGFAKMEVGDSHLELVGDGYAPEIRQRLCSAAWAFRDRHPEYKDWAFKTRINDQGVRIWRVK